MTVTKSNCFHNSPVSSSSRLVGKIKPLSVFGFIAQSSRFVLKSFGGLQNSFFASSTSSRFKKPSKPLAIFQPTSPVTTRICGPMELRGLQLIIKFGSIVRNIDERISMTNNHILEPVKPLSSEVNLNPITILPTLVVNSAPISKSSIFAEILEASKVSY